MTHRCVYTVVCACVCGLVRWEYMQPSPWHMQGCHTLFGAAWYSTMRLQCSLHGEVPIKHFPVVKKNKQRSHFEREPELSPQRDRPPSPPQSSALGALKQDKLPSGLGPSHLLSQRPQESDAVATDWWLPHWRLETLCRHFLTVSRSFSARTATPSPSHQRPSPLSPGRNLTGAFCLNQGFPSGCSRWSQVNACCLSLRPFVFGVETLWTTQQYRISTQDFAQLCECFCRTDLWKQNCVRFSLKLKYFLILWVCPVIKNIHTHLKSRNSKYYHCLQ